MKKIVYLFAILGLLIGQSYGQTTVTLPPLRGGSLSNFNSSAMITDYAMIESGGFIGFYKLMSGDVSTPASDSVIVKTDNTRWKLQKSLSPTAVTWDNVSSKPTLYTSPAGLKAALESLTGSARLDTSAIKNLAGITTESDPTVDAHIKAITTTNITNWNNSYRTGAEVVSSLSALSGTNRLPASAVKDLPAETDPNVGSHIKAITTTNISDWTASYRTGAAVKGALEGLSGASRLDASAIKNLPTVTDNSSVQKIDVRVGGTLIGTRKSLNLIAGSNATITGSDNGGSDRIDVTISATATGDTSGMPEPASNGIVVRTGAGSSAGRTLTAPAAGITISNADGVSGNPTFALADDLAGLEGLSTTGYVKRTGTGTFTAGTAIDLSTSEVTGIIAAGRFPALTGDVTTSAGSLSTTIANNAVTLGKMATVATGTILGRTTAGTGNVEALSAAQAKSVLSLGNVENTALSTWVGSTNITTLGTIGTGTWNGTVIANGYIATALTGKTYNGLTVSSTTGTLSITNGKTLSASNTLTFAGTDGSTLNIGTGGTLGTGAYATIANYATLANPTFTGTPAAPTATAGTNTTQIATTAFVQTAANTRPLIVDNIATLKTITGAAGYMVQTKGYYADGDGGGNTYYWNTSSTATEDGGSIIKATATTTGRWLSVEQNEVLVKRWGAKGDGSNDDTAFLSAALTYAINNSKNFVLTEGEYKVTASLYNTENNTGNKNLYIKLVGNVKITVPTGNSEINTALIVYGHNITSNVSITGGSLFVQLNNKCRGFLEARNNGIVSATYYVTTGGEFDISANSVVVKKAYAGSGSDKVAYGMYLIGSWSKANIQNVTVDSVSRHNSSGGECNGVAIASTRGLVSISNCRFSNVIAPASYLVDADGLKVFGMQEDAGVTNSFREGKVFINNCIFSDNQGRHLKFQTSSPTVTNCLFERKNVVGITSGHDIDFQFGNGTVLNNTFTYKKNGGTSPLGGSFIPVMFQEILTNREMISLAQDNNFYTEVAIRSPFYVITDTLAKNTKVDLINNKVTSILTLAGSASLDRGFCEFSAREVQKLGSNTMTITMDRNSAFSGGVPLLAYNSVSQTDLGTKLIFRLTNNTNDNTAVEPRAFAPISGSNITSVNKYQLWANSGYRADLTSNWSVNLGANRILPPTQFVIDLGTNSVTSGPTLGGSGYATVKVLSQWNGGQPVTEIYERTGSANEYLHVSVIGGSWKKATFN